MSIAKPWIPLAALTLLTANAALGQTFTIANATADEGAGTLDFTVSIDAALVGDVTVDVTLADDTAVSPDDYNSTTVAVTITAGQLTGTASVPIVDDGVFELDQSFTASLANPSSGALGIPSSAIGTITDNDTAPVASISDASVNEDDAGGVLSFTVDLDAASEAVALLTLTLTDGTAAAGTDYTGDPIDFSIAAGLTSVTVDVPIIDDAVFEGDQDFTAALSAPTNASVDGAAGSATGTIVDDETEPTLSLGDVTVSESDGVATVAATLSGRSEVDVTFTLDTTDGTALAGPDYTAISGGTGTVLALDLTGTIDISITNDAVDENDEAFTLSASSPSGASLVDDLAQITITNDDGPAPILVDDVARLENAGGATTAFVFTVSLAVESAKTVSVDIETADDTAVDGVDYTANSDTLTFTPGQTSRTFTVVVTDDAVFEEAETFNVVLSNATNGSLDTLDGADPAGVGTIQNDDAAPTISIQASQTIEEPNGGTADLDFDLTITGATEVDAAVRVRTRVGGSADPDLLATSGDDFNAVDTVVSFTAGGATTQTVSVAARADALDENDEVFEIFLSEPTSATLGATSVGRGTITDNPSDVPPDVSIDDLTVTEGDAPGTANVTLSLNRASGRLTSVRLTTADDTATAGVDYTTVDQVVTFQRGETTKLVPIEILGDLVDEPNEDIDTALSDFTNLDAGDVSGRIRINDDDDPPELLIFDRTITEGNVSAGVQLEVRLSQPSGFTVQVEADTSAGTATAGTDYLEVSNQQIIFNPGDTVATVTVAILGDTVDEQDETFTFSLSNEQNATYAQGGGGDIDQVTITIADDDDPPTLTIDNATILESAAGAQLQFVAALSATSGNAVDFDFATLDGTATAGLDYVARSGAATIPAGQLSTTIAVDVTPDALDEDDETLTLRLSNIAGAQAAGATLDATGTIRDDDPLPTVSVEDATLDPETDAAGALGFRVVLDAPSGRQVTVLATTALITDAITGAEAELSDFDFKAETLTFAPGETEKIFSVTTTGDNLEEADERMNVRLTIPTNAQLGDDLAVGTIVDDDFAPTTTGDSYAAVEDTPLVVSDPTLGVRFNDLDADDAALLVSLGDTVVGGVVSGLDPATGVFTFTPDPDFNGAASFEYTVDDGTHDPVVGVASITVSPVNDAPRVLARVDAGRPNARDVVDEDDTDPAGTAVSDVFDAAFTDPDLDVVGVAITGVNLPAEGGAWEFSVDGGASWQAIPTVSEDSALVLSAAAENRLRYVPPPQISEITASLDIFGWDATDGATSGDAAVSTLLRGGANAYSATGEAFEIAVSPVNDVPVITAPAPGEVFNVTEGETLVIDVEIAPDDGVQLDADFGPDSDALRGATAEFIAGNNEDGVFRITWTPAFFDAGTYALTVIVTDGVDLGLGQGQVEVPISFTVVAGFIDDDGDGIPDTREAQIGLSGGSLDSDDDGIPDAVEIGNDFDNPLDSDGDGTIDALDDDSDDDGVLDSEEAGDDDLDTEPVDTDEDGRPDYLDGDSDDDAVPDETDNCRVVENADQANNDGDDLGDLCDDDDDDDGVADVVEENLGMDPFDPDSDGDTIGDLEELGPNPATPRDTDDNEVIDALDEDSDGDGFSDAEEAGDADLATPPVDTDGDGVPDYRDDDIDNDGVGDAEDNCRPIANPGQEDLDEDGVGDACFNECGDGIRQFPEECDFNDPEAFQCNDACEFVPEAESCDGLDNDGDGEVDVELLEDGSLRSVCEGEITVTGGGVLAGCTQSAGPLPWGAALALLLLGALRRRGRGAALAAATLGVLVLGATGASAQLAAQQFRPATGGLTDFVTVQTPWHLEDYKLSAGAALHYGLRPLVVADSRTGAELALLEHQLQMDIVAALGLLDGLQLDVALPVALSAEGQDDTFNKEADLRAALGDLRLGGRWTAWSSADDTVGVAVAMRVGIPTGDPAAFTGHGFFTGHGEVIAGWRPTPNLRAAANLGVLLRPSQALFDVTIGNELTWAAGVEYQAVPQTIWLVGEAFGRVPITGELSGVAFPVEPHAALRWQVRPGHLVTFGAGFGVTGGYGSPTVRAQASYSFTMITPDSDADGFKDDRDACPNEPEDRDGHLDSDGCPDPDNDEDGVLDVDDQCPATPEDVDGFEDEDGCPDYDHDGDGIENESDKCPDVPEDRDGFEDEDGCADPDNDGDGFGDLADKCPFEPETPNGFEDSDGCPDEVPAAAAEAPPEEKPDAAPDDTPEATDKPDAPPEATPEVKPEAKPEPEEPKVARPSIELPQRLRFQLAGTQLTTEGVRLAKQVAETLERNPHVTLVEVGGHSDASGSPLANWELSIKRANAVIRVLVEYGVSPQRLVPRGFGESVPLADNETAEGRARNRRVEFRVLEQGE